MQSTTALQQCSFCSVSFRVDLFFSFFPCSLTLTAHRKRDFKIKIFILTIQIKLTVNPTTALIRTDAKKSHGQFHTAQEIYRVIMMSRAQLVFAMFQCSCCLNRSKHISCDLMMATTPFAQGDDNFTLNAQNNHFQFARNVFFHSFAFFIPLFFICANWMWLNLKWKTSNVFFFILTCALFPCDFICEFVQLIMTCQSDNHIWMNALISLYASYIEWIVGFV